MAASTVLFRESTLTHNSADRLLVTIRRATEAGVGSYIPVGFLSHMSDRFSFSYLKSAVADPEFRPLFGFRRTDLVYESDSLFPLFGERIMSAKRPERPDYLRTLHLDDQSEPWEILGRSGGRRIGDTIEVIPEPVVAGDGSFTATFLVHGVRYRSEQSQARITRLRSGEKLSVERDPGNEASSFAVKVMCDQELHLGFVPEPLAEFVCRALPNDPELLVVQANGPDAPPHLRLLVRLSGRLQPGERAFDGPLWETV